MPPGIDTTQPHSARMYDYFLGGKDHYAADRETAEKAIAELAVRCAPRSGRTGRSSAGPSGTWSTEAGIRQFLDIGTGLPSANNVHEVGPGGRAGVPGWSTSTTTRSCCSHARALLTSSTQGRTAYIQADLREPGKILASPEVGQTLDLDPAGRADAGRDPALHDRRRPPRPRSCRTLLDALPPGSFLVASHVTPEHDPAGVGGLEAAYQAGGVPTPVPDRRRVQRAGVPRPGADRPRRGAGVGVAAARWQRAGRLRPRSAGTAASAASPPSR